VLGLGVCINACILHVAVLHLDCTIYQLHSTFDILPLCAVALLGRESGEERGRLPRVRPSRGVTSY